MRVYCIKIRDELGIEEYVAESYSENRLDAEMKLDKVKINIKDYIAELDYREDFQILLYSADIEEEKLREEKEYEGWQESLSDEIDEFVKGYNASYEIKWGKTENECC